MRLNLFAYELTFRTLEPAVRESSSLAVELAVRARGVPLLWWSTGSANTCLHAVLERVEGQLLHEVVKDFRPIELDERITGDGFLVVRPPLPAELQELLLIVLFFFLP